MGRYSEALKESVAEYARSVAKEIQDCEGSETKLCEFARKYVADAGFRKLRANYGAILAGWLINGEKPSEIVAFARRSKQAYEGLKTVCFHLKEAGETLPAEFVEIIIDVELKIIELPKKEGAPKWAHRNFMIVRCIEQITENTKLRAQRAVGSEKLTAISIVADAVGLSYVSVEEIWKNRGKNKT